MSNNDLRCNVMYEEDAAVQTYYVILFMLYYIAMIEIVICLCYDMHMSVNVITTIVRTRRNVVCPHFSIGSKSADRQAFCLSAKMMGVGVGGQHRQSAIAHV